MSAPSIGDAVTRCPCGDNDDQLGLMIQCEVCSVWQHSECVGVTEQTVPEKYYCDACMPDHPIHVRNRTILSALPSRALSKDFAKLKKGYTKTGPPGEKKRKRKEEEIKEETKCISREERKLKSVLQTFERLENRGKRKSEEGQASKSNKHEGRTKPEKGDPSPKGRSKKGRHKGTKTAGEARLSVAVDVQSDGVDALSPSSSSSSPPASPSEPLSERDSVASATISSFVSISTIAPILSPSPPSVVSTATTSSNVSSSSGDSGDSRRQGSDGTGGNGDTATSTAIAPRVSSKSDGGSRTGSHSSSSRSRSSKLNALTSRPSQQPEPLSDSNAAASPADRKRSRENSSTRPASRQAEERKPKTPKVVTPKQKRPRAGQLPTEPSHWERRRVCPLAPLYLGKQRYILSLVHEQHLTAKQLDVGVDGWRANLLDSSMPVKLRVLNALRRPLI